MDGNDKNDLTLPGVENPLALSDEEFRKMNMDRVVNGVKDVGEGIKNVGEGIFQMGEIARENKKQIRWYFKITLVLIILMGALIIISLAREPGNFSRAYYCSQDGYETKFTSALSVIPFKRVFPNATCRFDTQKEQGWWGLVKHKIADEDG